MKRILVVLVICVLNAQAVIADCFSEPTGMVSWWRWETNALDTTATNSGVPHGSVVFAPGEVGQGLVLNGADAYVQIASTPSLNVGADEGMTMEMWIKPAVAGNFPVVEWNSGSQDGVHLWLNGGGSLYVNLRDTDLAAHTLYSSQQVVSSNIFQHLALTYDKSDGLCTLYLNGTNVAQANFGNVTPLTTANLFVGWRPGQSYYYAGLIDELSLYNRALKPDEIGAIFNAGSAGKCGPAIAPNITSQPTNQIVLLGNTVALSVSATGTTPLSYQWLFYGTNISGATNATLIFTDAQLTNAGLYSVVVSNSLGFINSAKAVLQVLPPGAPSIQVDGQVAVGTTTTTNSVQVTMTSGFPSGYIFYTLDGSAPDVGGQLYGGPIILTNTAVVQALGLSSDFLQTASAPPVTVQILPIYRLQTSVIGNGSLNITPNGDSFVSNSVVTLTATASTHWAFDYWTGDLSGTQNPTTIPMNGPRNVQAVFKQSEFPLTVSSPGGGNVTVNGQAITPETFYPLGSAVTLSASGNSGWTFLHWRGDTNGANNPLQIIITTTNTIQAVFGTVVATSGLGGGSVVLSQPNPVPYGTALTAAAVPDNGKYFVTWSGVANGTNSPFTFAVTTPTPDVSALFATLPGGKVSLSTVVSGTGSVSINPQQNYYNLGDVVTLTAIPDSGAQFYGWLHDATGTNNPLAVTMTTNKVVQANFAGPLSVTVTPPSQVVQAGNGAVLLASAAGVATFSYQWWNAAGPILNATNATLDFNPAQTNQSDNYFVVLSNLYGSVTSSVAQLTVFMPISIVAQPSSQSVPFGTPATFTVTADGFPGLFYQWSLNGTNIVGATSNSLTIAHVQLADLGNYAVQIRNAYSSTNSTIAILTLDGPLGLFVVRNNLDSGPGSLRDAELNLNATGGGTIVFSNVNGTIALTSGQLVLTQNFRILGSGCTNTVVDGAAIDRVFNVGLGTTGLISGLTITNGIAEGSGGGLINCGYLTLSNCSVVGNLALGPTNVALRTYTAFGGGLFNSGVLSLYSCAISKNAVGLRNGAPAGLGAGIFNSNICVSTDCRIMDNISYGLGAGCYNCGHWTVTNCTLNENITEGVYVGGTLSPGDGGAIYNLGTSLLVCCEIYSNASTVTYSTYDRSSGGSGAGIFNSGFLDFKTCNIHDNTCGRGTPGGASNPGTGGNGGALWSSGTAYIENSMLCKNAAGDGGNDSSEWQGGNGGAGGAIWNSGNLSIVNSAIFYNHAGNGGQSATWIYRYGNRGANGGAGGGVFNSGVLVLTNCLILSNTSGKASAGAPGYAASGGNYPAGSGGTGGNGAGIYSQNFLYALNNTIAGNQTGAGGAGGNFNTNSSSYPGANGAAAGSGGGIYIAAGTCLLWSCTVAGSSCGMGGAGGSGIPFGTNGLPGNGGGLFCSGATVQVFNTIITSNNAVGLGPDINGNFVSLGFNLVSDTNSGIGFGVANDLLGVDPLLGSLSDNGGPTLTMALLPGSPAIDQGNSGGIVFDQRGMIRPFDIPGIPNASDGSDIGAFEFTTPFPQFTFTASAQGAGRVNPSGSFSAIAGTSQTFTAQPLATYTVSEWLLDGNIVQLGGDTFNLFNIQTNHNVLVTFTNNFRMVAWGADTFGETNTPPDLTGVIAIAAGAYHNLALKTDGTVVAWGQNNFGQTNTPLPLANVDGIAAGWGTSFALRHDDTVDNWGWDTPDKLLAQATNLSNIVGISAGWDHALAVTGSRKAIAWGKNTHDQTNAPPDLTNVVSVAAGGYHSLALLEDGTVVAWGDNNYGQTNIPANLSNVVAIAGGGYHSLALKHDGTVVAWGNNDSGQTNIPAGLVNVIAISAGFSHSLALKQDGTVVAWGDNSFGQTNVPPDLTNVVVIAAGGNHNLVLVADRLPAIQFAGVSYDLAGQFHVSVMGSTGDVFRVLASTNLTDWQTIATVTNSNGTATFIDPSTTNFSQRFYRLVMP